MKKFLAIMAVLLIVTMSFVACGEKDTPAPEPTSTVEAEPTPEVTPEGNTEETPTEESGEQAEGSEVVPEE